jgi:DNA polymerase-1
MGSERLQELFEQFKGSQYENRNRNNRIMIVDGLNLFVRAFTGSPLMNHRGDHVGGVVGFMKSLFSIIRKFGPTRCVLVFDGENSSHRRRVKFPAYKTGRKNRDRLNRYVEVDGILDEITSMKNQFVRLEQYIHLMPFTLVCIDYAEADDVIGYIVTKHYRSRDFDDILIVSSDKDFLQLVNDKVNVYSPTKKKLYTPTEVIGEYGISPKNYLTYRTLTGDPSDSIPGVRGMGLKTMLKCYPEMASVDVDIEDIFEITNQRISDGSKAKVYRNILDAKDQVILNRELMQLSDADIAGPSKTHIDMVMDELVYPMDKKRLSEMIYEDGINDHFLYFDSWLVSTLAQLSVYARSK